MLVRNVALTKCTHLDHSSGQTYVFSYAMDTLSPMIPTRIKLRLNSRAVVAGSLNRTMLNAAVPIAPMPTQTA